MKRAALHLVGLQLAVARELRELAHLLRDLHDAFLVGVADHRHDQALRRVGGEADVVVLLEDEVVAVERSVELREFRERRARAALIMNASMLTRGRRSSRSPCSTARGRLRDR